MANQQTPTNKRSPSQGAAQPARRGTSTTGSQRAPAPPVERDETYGLISVIYHSLQGSDTIGNYIADARRADDDELVEFFERCKRQHESLALEGKRLLASHLAEAAEEDEDESDDDDDEDDEDDDDDDDEDEDKES